MPALFFRTVFNNPEKQIKNFVQCHLNVCHRKTASDWLNCCQLQAILICDWLAMTHVCNLAGVPECVAGLAQRSLHGLSAGSALLVRRPLGSYSGKKKSAKF
jgi:hypothetical protein